MSFERQFYAFIRAYHRTRGISVPDFAAMIGREPRQTYRIVNAQVKLTVKDMEEIMERLGYDMKFEPVRKDRDHP